MPQQTINNAETGLVVRTKLNDNFTELYTLVSNAQNYPQVNTFADLPAPSGVSDPAIYVVKTTTGVWPVRRYAGFYRSDGASWLYLGNFTWVANEIQFNPVGTIVGTNVQAVGQEIDSRITAHIGSSGASHQAVTTSVNGFMLATDKTKLDAVQAGATANSSDAFLLSRANHAGTQLASTISDFTTASNTLISGAVSTHSLNSSAHAVATTTVPGFLSASDKTKLDSIASGATSNSTDAFLLSRANHTGTQLASTISDFTTAADARASAAISAHTALADPHPIYLTQAEGDALYAVIAHTHTIAQITGLQTALDGKLGVTAEAATVNTISGRISQGTGVTITGSGTAASPFVINSAGGGGAGLSGQVALTLPNTNGGVQEWSEGVVATGVTPSSVVVLSLQGATDVDENDPEMLDLVALSAVPGTNGMNVNITFSQPTSGPVKINWRA